MRVYGKMESEFETDQCKLSQVVIIGNFHIGRLFVSYFLKKGHINPFAIIRFHLWEL